MDKIKEWEEEGRCYSVVDWDKTTGKLVINHMYPVDQSLRNIHQQFTDIAQTNERLSERVQELMDEKWTDKRLVDMQAELDQMRIDYRRGFPISEKEQEKIREWKKNHQHYGGAIGGTFTYEFTPTSIGTVGVIKCTCGEHFTFCDL